MGYWAKSSGIMTLSRRIPYYRQLISFASDGFAALDEESQDEVRKFILEQQAESGGFCDRAGYPDLYYTLFGFFLTAATRLDLTHSELVNLAGSPSGRNGLNEIRTLLHRYVNEQQRLPQNSLINNCCLAIIEKEKPGNTLRKISRLIAILKDFLSGAGDITRSYQYFMVFLSFDAYGLNNGLTRLMARPFFKKQISMAEMPCPVVAATLVLKSELGLPAENEYRQLMEFFDEEHGFRALAGAPSADLLSTAVALAALKLTGADLRLVRPVCLKLLEENFDSGAFLAGNGDWERDTEYTFYGLMALGLLT
jgi:prenyltransferase beta subunit